MSSCRDLRLHLVTKKRTQKNDLYIYLIFVVIVALSNVYSIAMESYPRALELIRTIVTAR